MAADKAAESLCSAGSSRIDRPMPSWRRRTGAAESTGPKRLARPWTPHSSRAAKPRSSRSPGRASAQMPGRQRYAPVDTSRDVLRPTRPGEASQNSPVHRLARACPGAIASDAIPGLAGAGGGGRSAFGVGQADRGQFGGERPPGRRGLGLRRHGVGAVNDRGLSGLAPTPPARRRSNCAPPPRARRIAAGHRQTGGDRGRSVAAPPTYGVRKAARYRSGPP